MFANHLPNTDQYKTKNQPKRIKNLKFSSKINKYVRFIRMVNFWKGGRSNICDELVNICRGYLAFIIRKLNI